MFGLSRILCRVSIAQRTCPLLTQVRHIKLKIVQPTSPTGGNKPESYDEKNMRLGRMVGPYLTIYKPQLTSFLSLSHRATGIILSGYTYLLGFAALLTPHDVCHYVTMIEGLCLSPFLLYPIKFILAFPFTYHYCNGIRHLVWDAGLFLGHRQVYSTGYAMVVAAFVTCAILAFL